MKKQPTFKVATNNLGAVLGVSKKPNKFKEAIQSAGEKVEGLFDASELKSLESRLKTNFTAIDGAISKQSGLLKAQALNKALLANWTEQLNNMNSYLRDYHNSLWFVSTKDKIHAAQDAEQAYDIIKQVIKKPNATNPHAAILKIRDANLQKAIYCLIAGLVLFAALILLPLALKFSGVAFIATSFWAAFPIGALGYVGLTLQSQGTKDNQFCDTFQTTMPSFFVKADKNILVTGAGQKEAAVTTNTSGCN